MSTSRIMNLGSLLRSCFLFLMLFLSLVMSPTLLGQERYPWQISYVEPATEHMTQVVFFHNYTLMGILVGIFVVVIALMLWCLWRYRQTNSPNPTRKRHHHVALEVIWMLIPLLLIFLMLPQSLRLVLSSGDHTDVDITVKVTGHQWYWSYEYPDEKISYDSLLVTKDAITPKQVYLLSATDPLVVPVNTKVRVIITASDVIHSWAVPAFGVKIDAIPGQLNQIAFKASRVGVFYGQCSELCGRRHAFMPIEVHVLSKDDYQRWLSSQRKKR